MHIKRFNLEIEKAYAIGLTAIHIHSFPYLLEEFIDSLYYCLSYFEGKIMNSFKRFDLFHRCHAFVIRHSVKVHTLYCTFARKKSENAILYIKSEQLTGKNI